MLKDADVYISVARKLTSNAQPFYSDNLSNINHILNNIESLNLIEEPLFSETVRKVDYSQFKPSITLTRIFLNFALFQDDDLAWKNRTYLIKPVSMIYPRPIKIFKDIVIDSYLISEAIKHQL